LELPADVKFRLEAAARVLERAASRANDVELRNQLIKLASSLRSFAGGNVSALRDVEVTGARAKTVDDIVREIREFIWSSLPKEREPRVGREIALVKRILKPIEAFEKMLEDIDRKLEELLP